MQVGMPLAVDHAYCSRLLSGQMQEWEEQDPPCGCLADGPALATGQCHVSAHLPELAALMQRALQDAVSAGDPATARALVGAVSKIAVMERILPDRDALHMVG